MTRLRYDKSHWSRRKDTGKALEEYLNLSQKEVNRIMIEFLKKLTGNVAGKEILDYGGGAGIMSIFYAENGANVTLVDAEENALSVAMLYAEKRHVKNRIKIINSEKFPKYLINKKYDIIIAKDVIEHIENDQEFLINLSNCQDKGGVLLLSTQNKFSLNYILEGSYQKYRCKNLTWCGWDTTHLRFYTPWSLKCKLIKAGYTPEKLASTYIIPYDIFSWLLLLRFNIYTPALYYFDMLFGRLYPFNRIGWNFVVRATKNI